MELLNQTCSPQAGNLEEQDSKEASHLAYAGWVYPAFLKWAFNGKTRCETKRHRTPLSLSRSDLTVRRKPMAQETEVAAKERINRKISVFTETVGEILLYPLGGHSALWATTCLLKAPAVAACAVIWH